MRELAKSILGATWSASLLGAQQMLGLLSPSRSGSGGSTVPLDRVSDAARRQAGATFDPVDSVLRLGNEIQGSLVDLTGRGKMTDLFDPRTMVALSADVIQRSFEGLRLSVDPRAAFDALREVQNKLEVYVLVRQVGRLIGVPDQFPLPLLELIHRCYDLTPFQALWAVEGLGHDYGDSYWDNGLVPRRLLTEGQGLALPEKSLLMMHAGVGLSIADHLLEDVSPRISSTEMRRIMAEIVGLCRDNSRPGFVGAAYESIGLVTRLFHPDLMPQVDAALREVDPSVVGFFWHGAGRAIYFRPVNFLPGSTWQAFEMARREAPDTMARLNAVAGVTWAFVLVNQRQPELMANLLLAPHGDQLSGDSAFTNGLCSGVIMRADTTPEAPFIQTFLHYQPPDPRVARLWEDLVRIPGEKALNVYYPILKAEDRLGDLFHYGDLARLASSLEGGQTPGAAGPAEPFLRGDPALEADPTPARGGDE
ncbi:MAG TPA: hypothetical protein VGG03_06515 [Thermoanaerobaculia bacterium]|jgi:hypothetical protein